ncbi:MAG: hypothetical protein ABR572_11805 [Cryomorphaceae bacterium]|nr:hypothetical protein [Flavobacteriales bacterium]
MKKTILTLALTAGTAATMTASVPNEPEKIKKNPVEILNEDLNTLFKLEILNEAVHTPIYTTVEQLIFAEQVKQLKAAQGEKNGKKKN